MALEGHRQAAILHPAYIMAPYDYLLGKEGVEAIIALCDVLGGTQVYIPSARCIFEKCIAAQILVEYNGYNINALARKFGYSSRQIRRIIKNGP